MKIYTIYSKEKDPFKETVEVIPEGFNFKAFLFNFFWLVYHQLWLESSIFLAFFALTKYVLLFLSTPTAVILFVGFFTFLGISGYDFIRGKLIRSGYKLVDVIFAASEDEARYKFISKALEQYEYNSQKGS